MFGGRKQRITTSDLHFIDLWGHFVSRGGGLSSTVHWRKQGFSALPRLTNDLTDQWNGGQRSWFFACGLQTHQASRQTPKKTLFPFSILCQDSHFFTAVLSIVLCCCTSYVNHCMYQFNRYITLCLKWHMLYIILCIITRVALCTVHNILYRTNDRTWK